MMIKTIRNRKFLYFYFNFILCKWKYILLKNINDASIKYIFTASDQNGYYKLSNDKILINVIIGDDHSSGFQFVMQYKNINDIYVTAVGQAVNNNFSNFILCPNVELNIWYINERRVD